MTLESTPPGRPATPPEMPAGLRIVEAATAAGAAEAAVRIAAGAADIGVVTDAAADLAALAAAGVLALRPSPGLLPGPPVVLIARDPGVLRRALGAAAIPASACALAIPGGALLQGPAFADALLCDLAGRAGAARVRIAVVGAHLSGQPLNHQLTGRGGRLVAATRTSPDYRLYRLPGTVPAKPGLVRAPGAGAVAIEVEVWELGEAEFGSFVAEVPPPLAIGTVRLQDGDEVAGFVCEPAALEGARDISHHGGWRAFLAAGG
jgi:Allophanate hydrolase C-terminal domain